MKENSSLLKIETSGKKVRIEWTSKLCKKSMRMDLISLKHCIYNSYMSTTKYIGIKMSKYELNEIH